MKKNEKAMINYHQDATLYVETLRIFVKKTHDLELKSYLYRIVEELNDTVNEICKFLKNHLNKTEDELSFVQKVTLQIDKMKTRMINNDFSLCVEVAKVFHTILFKAMKFIFNHQKIDKDYLALVNDQISLCLSLESEMCHFIHETYLNF